MKQTKENSRNWDEYMLPYLVKNVNFAYFSDSIPLEDIVPQMKKVKREAFIYNTEFFYILTIRNGFVRSYIRLFENENKIYKSTIASIERYLDIKPIEKKEELNEDKKELEEKEGESK